MRYNFPDIPASCQIANLGEIYDQYIGYKTDGYFVEIGAFDGYSWSNTLPLIEAGWRGVMVEADPKSFELLRRRHRLNRSLILVGSVVSDSNGTARFYPGGSTGTTVMEMIDVFRKNPHTPLTDGMNEGYFIEVNSWRLTDLLEYYQYPTAFDVLSIDVEGGELSVLRGYDIDKHRPKLVIIEAVENSPSHFLQFSAKGIHEYFTCAHYARIQYDGMNAIYLDQHYETP